MKGYIKFDCIGGLGEHTGIGVETKLRDVSFLDKISLMRAMYTALNIDKALFELMGVLFDEISEAETVIDVSAMLGKKGE